MPLYEFNNKETGESVGELFLTFEQRDDFLRQNPNLCVAPGKLRYMKLHSSDSLNWPSYPDMDNETRCDEERGQDWTPSDPATWKDTTDPTENYTKYKVTDRRKNKISHFDEDIKKYGRIVGAPKMLGSSETGFKYESVEISEPITDKELQEFNKKYEEENPRAKFDKEYKVRGNNAESQIDLTDNQDLMPWEKGFAKHVVSQTDRARMEADKQREYEILHPEEE